MKSTRLARWMTRSARPTCAPPSGGPVTRDAERRGRARLLRLVAARQLRVAFGYERRFGLVHVDFETQRRTPKLSALAYANFLRQR